MYFIIVIMYCSDSRARCCCVFCSHLMPSSVSLLGLFAHTVESIDGFTAYMNVLLRCNDMITSLHLNRVVDQWAKIPDESDGYVYYKIRPPWLKCTAVSSFYALHPDLSTFSGC